MPDDPTSPGRFRSDTVTDVTTCLSPPFNGALHLFPGNAPPEDPSYGKIQPGAPSPPSGISGLIKTRVSPNNLF